jgi:uncharacterized delta-60 repeat protein
MKNIALLLLALLFITVSAKAQLPGTLDSTFNGIGFNTHDFGFQDNLNDVKVLPNQQILCTGVALSNVYTGELKVLRYNPNGMLDNGFGNGGVFSFLTTTETYGFDSYRLSNGKIIICGLAAITFGYYDILLLRIDENGTLDQTFGNNGFTVTSFSGQNDFAYAMDVQTDGKIVVAGSITDTVDFWDDPAIMRFTENGFADPTFGVNGKVTIPAIDFDNELTSIVIQDDGKIVASGHYSKVFTGNMDFDVLVFRVDTNGVPDPSFGVNGIVKTSINPAIDDAFGLALDTAQNIIVAGFTSAASLDMALLKYDQSGTLDPNFGVGGIVISDITDTDVGYDVEVQPDNKIIVGGSSGTFLASSGATVWKYLPNGTLDSTFATNGIVTTHIGPNNEEATGIALQADGKIVAAGKYNNPGSSLNDAFVLRYHNGGVTSLSEPSAQNEFAIYPNPITAGEQITIYAQQGYGKNMQIQISDVTGKVLIVEQILNSGNTKTQMHIPSIISSGVYFMLLTDGKSQQMQKLLVK